MTEVAAAVIIDNGKVLLASRPADKPPAGWEFPGGKLEPGESVADAAVRELMEELALEVTPGEIMQQLTAGNIRLHFIRCFTKESSRPSPRENQQFCWHEITQEPPEGLLKNDLFFWKFLISVK